MDFGWGIQHDQITIEEKGGTRALTKDALSFQSFIDTMKLVDIDTSNGLFIWNSRRGGQSLMASKLEIFIISEELILNDNGMEARILPFGGSDHWTIQLEIRGIGTPRNRSCRFETIWLTHPDFINKISSWWSEDLHIQGTSMFLLHKRLKHIKLMIKEWNKKEFGNFFEGKKAVENKLQILNQSLIKVGFDKFSNDRATNLQHKWENLCKQKEIFWRQNLECNG